MSDGASAFLLSFGLPSVADGRLLRLCLAEGPLPDGTSVESLLAELTDLAAGRRWMLPLLADRLERAGRIEGPAGIRLRAAALHEAGRSATFDAITADLVAALDHAGCPVLLSRGHALALTAYARSGLRHRHDLDLLVPPDGMPVARGALERAGLNVADANGPSMAGGIALEHGSGLRIVLHAGPMPCAGSDLDFDALAAAATMVPVAHGRVRVPDPTVLLLHVLLLSACFLPNRLTWVADAAVAIWDGRVAWDRVAAVRGADAIDVLARLTYLAEVAGVAAPDEVSVRLRLAVGGLDRDARDAALARARRRGGLRAMIRQGMRFGAGGLLLRWSAGQLVAAAPPRHALPGREEAEIGRH